MNKDKLHIELDKSDFSKWNYLTNKDLQLIDLLKKRLGSLNSLTSITTILLLCMMFLYELKYSEFVFLIVSILVIITTIYVLISTINIKKQIKYILFPTLKEKEVSSKLVVKIYKNKIFDRGDIFLMIMFFIWGISSLVWSIDRLL